MIHHHHQAELIGLALGPHIKWVPYLNLDQGLAYLAVVFRAFRQSIEENVGIVPSHMSHSLHPISLAVHRSQASYHTSLTSNSWNSQTDTTDLTQKQTPTLRKKLILFKSNLFWLGVFVASSVPPGTRAAMTIFLFHAENCFLRVTTRLDPWPPLDLFQTVSNPY